MIELIKLTCFELKISEAVTNTFLETLHQNKEKLCHGQDTEEKLNTSLLETLEEQKVIQKLIVEFFQELQVVKPFNTMPLEEQEQMKQDFGNRIAKILLSPQLDSLILEPEKMDKIVVNSDEPMLVAAEVFKDTLMGVGVSEDIADMSKRAFYSLKMN